MLADQSIDSYLQRLAGKSSTPGGGAAAGISGAQAAALLGMVAQYSKDESLSLPTIIALCETSSRHFLTLAEQDITGFNGVMAAYGLPATDAAAKQLKQAALQQALEAAAQAPTEMIKACIALLSTALTLCNLGNKNLITDVGIAASLLLSCIQSSRLNLLVNLKAIKNQTFIDDSLSLLAATATPIADFNQLIDSIETGLAP
ncbi:MAG: cyclodeaminase/cyclohydrolase family protein [SAR86 cluster bacterium]|jgi:methenyltetrahydrofolate cyclohydrolase|tara:strand:- start:18975 stop:19583 length:609 start_codon:yes stop_codon:yes gene_type:complete